MAQRLSFHFRPGNSLFHRSDARIEFFLYIGFNLMLSGSSTPVLLSSTLLLIVLAIPLNIDVRTVACELRGFFWICIISYISQAHLAEGMLIAVFPEILPWKLHINWNVQGAFSAGKFVLQLLSTILSTHILMLTTKLSDLQQGLFYIFAPFHSKAAWIFSTMLRLMLSAIPLLLDSATKASDGLSMRGLQARKKPLVYFRAMGLGMLRSVNSLTDNYSRALLIRAWSLDGPQKKFSPISSPRASFTLGFTGAAFITAGIVFTHIT